MVQNVTYQNFIKQYINSFGVNVKIQDTPLQVYQLDGVAENLMLPTPLMNADYYFFVHLNKGTFIQQVGNSIIEVGAPAILFVPQGEIFSIKSIINKLDGYFVLIERKVLTATLNKTEFLDLLRIESVIKLKLYENQWLSRVCSLLFEELSSNSPNRKISNGLLQAILHRLISISDGSRIFTRQNEIATQFKLLLNENFKDEKNVGFYAKSLNISENYLNRCVKSYYNKSCKQIILETVILKSQIMMFETSKDISEITFEMGYSDPSYFARLYKKQTNETPSEFKNKIKHRMS